MTEQQGEGTVPDAATGAPDAPPRQESPDRSRRLALRRAPRYRAFVLTGVAVGVVAGILLVLAFSVPGSSKDDGFSTGTLVGYLAVSLGLLGGLLGGLVAVLLERPRRRRRG